ncbi:hypothetical protein [Nocardiopsis sp. FR26]|uniref:hypothetical protein n=1 Tax=Nocardiopsis sp. FR26 TaxID=2605987 RepID=UPI00135C79A9|nr:hypothetical protein [Nocardiopsis sp. FR26]
MDAIENAAPYPTSPEDATADRIIANLAATAQFHRARTLELERLHLTDEAAYHQSAEIVVWTTTALHFLYALQRADPARADKAAREAFGMWKNRDLLASLPDNILRLRGFDAYQLIQAGIASVDESL